MSVLRGRDMRGGLVARLQLHETVAYMARATCVTAAAELDGELLLSDRCIHFVPESAAPARKDRLCIPHVQAAAEAQSWPLEAVLQVATRRWCLQERAVELFLSSGHAHMLAFADQHERAAFLKALASTQHPPARLVYMLHILQLQAAAEAQRFACRHYKRRATFSVNEEKQIYYRVSQGSILGPILLTVYVDDIFKLKDYTLR